MPINEKQYTNKDKMADTRPASFVNAVVTGVSTSLAFALGCPEVQFVGVNGYAGDNLVGDSVRTVAAGYEKLFGREVGAFQAGALPISFVGFLAGFAGSYILDKVWLLATGKAPENQTSNFTSFVQTAVISTAIAPVLVLPLVTMRMPPFNPQSKGLKLALLFAAGKLASQGLYQQLILDEAVGGGL